MTDAEFRAAFHAHKDSVYRFAWRMLGAPHAAEDVAQETFLTLLRLPGRFDASRGPLRSFLFGVARNLALKKCRDASRWDALSDEEAFEPPDAAERGEIAGRVAAAVRALPPYQREALILAEYEELTLEEIAGATGVEIGTVKSRLFRARENLRRALAPLRSHKVST